MIPTTYDQCNIEKIENGYIIRFNGTTPSTDPEVPPQWHTKTVFVATAEEMTDAIKSFLG